MTHTDGNERERVAWVTGSSSGIGSAIAETLSKDFSVVVVHGFRNPTGAKEVAERIRQNGTEADVVIADLSDQQAREQAIQSVVKRHGVPGALVNNAGLDVLTGDAKDWDFQEKLNRLWSVDVLGTIMLSRELGRRMKDIQHRRTDSGAYSSTPFSIVNMGWDQAETGMEGDSGEMFATIKGAIMAFTRSLAKTLAPEVRVNCVAPGWIKTKWGDSTDDYWNARAKRESLLGRWGTASDVAQTVRFLVSESARFVNGQIIPVNGGFTSSVHRSGE